MDPCEIYRQAHSRQPLLHPTSRRLQHPEIPLILPHTPMHPTLTFEESRVLGCLLEKEMSTPDYYPLTMPALVAACNQSTNRDPVVAWDARTVEAAATGLRRKSLAAMVHLAGSRVPKFKHLLDDFFSALGRPERALLAVLLLRGPQTIAELRTRTERMHEFTAPDELEAALTLLLDHAGDPLVAHLPPGGGRRVATYAHLLCGEVSTLAAPSPAAEIIPPATDLVADMARQLADLRAAVEGLKRRLAWLEESLGSKAPDGTGQEPPG